MMADAPEIAEEGHDWWWHQGREGDADYYAGSAKTRSEAEAKAREEGEADGYEHFCLIYGCPAKLSFDVFDAEHIFDLIVDHNDECWGEDGVDSWKATAEQEHDLQQRLSQTLAAWVAETKAIRAWTIQTVHDEVLEHRKPIGSA